ncbi:MAG: NADH-ubiquinone oxidoreductase-F iron-sulfur binding region domain-containing protein [Kiritimatiellia bacterium]
MNKHFVLIKDTGPGAEATGEFYTAFVTRLREANLETSVQAVRAADIGVYGRGIAVRILPGGPLYVNVRAEDIDRIIAQTLKNNVVLKDLVPGEETGQMRIVLRNCGVIDPESIEDYFSVEGYQGLGKCLFEHSPEKVIEEVKKSGLRGRGGGGYPTHLKWALARKAFGEEKFVICNGDEGDPGAYMDRSILESDPHAVVEGMVITAYAVGAHTGIFYIRAEYPLAIKRIQRAIDQAREHNLLGADILGSGFSFDCEIRLGAGAFVCGEETALIASVEGRRGTPRPRPPYPSDSGLWGMPSVINNVETMANLPVIMRRGGEWLARIGTAKSKGTKVFALTGNVRNSGLVEIPMGTTLRAIVEGIGGGSAGGKPIKAVQTGGPSGGIIPVDRLDTPVSYEHLQELGSIMGSGGMIVLTEEDCIVDIAKFYLGFCVDESCGKCAPCRIGGWQMLRLLEKIAGGEGEEQDLEKVRRLAQAMQKASLCGLGQSAPNPVLSTLKYFAGEYREHVVEKKCRAGKCLGLVRFVILPEVCKRCKLCVGNCPVNAISGDRQSGFVIDQAKCIKCGKCFEVCKFGAVARR